MAKKRKKNIYFIALGMALTLLLSWMFVTCATDPVARKSLKNAFIHEPKPTPLPALPADGVGKLPGYGEPPVPVYDGVQRDDIENLPVGNSKSTLKNINDQSGVSSQ